MHSEAQELLRGFKATLNDIIAPELPKRPFLQAQVLTMAGLIDQLAAQWDTEAQRLIDERRSLTCHFQEALDVIQSSGRADSDSEIAELARDLKQAISQQNETDFRLSSLAERNREARALTARLLRVCDKASGTAGLDGLATVQGAIIRDMEANLAAHLSPGVVQSQ